MKLRVSEGFVVMFMNPRGSDGYDEEFADIRGHYGERDYEDLMEGLDYVLRSYDFIDPGRLGPLTGHPMRTTIALAYGISVIYTTWLMGTNAA
ncbi:hypothetical protein JCM14467A_13450 [Vulcanisaeta sp. JCM 14467]